MSEEAPDPPRYRLLPRGVIDTLTGREILPVDDDWGDYIAWLRAGNAPLPMLEPQRAPDRSYFTNAGANRRSRELSKLSDEEYLAQLRKGKA